MPNENNEILKNIEENSEMNIIQSSETTKAVEDLETPLEGILLKTDEIAENTKPKDVQKIKIETGEDNELANAFFQMLRGPRGHTPELGKDFLTEEDLTKIKKEVSESKEAKGEKGDKGDDGKDGADGSDGIDGLDGEDGKDGLDGDDGKDGTSVDQEAIITAIVKKLPKNKGKQPVVETATQIKQKLEGLKKGLDYDSLSNLPDLARMISVARNQGKEGGSKTVSLAELDDVDLSGLTQDADGNYILGGGGGSGDVVGPASATDGVVALYDGTTGKLLKNSAYTPAALLARANHTGTQLASTISDFDTEVSNNASVAANTAKVTNATHTGQVTGATVLTLDVTAISDQTLVTAVATDMILIEDATDGALKRVDASDFLDGAGDVVGPASAVDSNFPAFDTTTGKLIKDSGVSASTFATAAQGALADSASQATGVENNADVTDTANVTSAGALMDSEVDADIKTLVLPASTTISTFGASLIDDVNASTARATLELIIGTDVQGWSAVLDATTASFTTADETKLDGIEALADVTDTANVTAAGALMDSELTSIADVKALDQSVVSGATPTFTTTNFTDATNKRLLTDAQEALVDGSMQDLVDDTTPELGGELDCGAHSIGFTMQTATGDGTTTIDWKLGNHFDFTFGAFNETFTFTAPTNPGVYTLSLLQDSVGSRTATWPATVKWAGGGTAPTLTTTATTGYDICSFRFDGTNYYAVPSLDFS